MTNEILIILTLSIIIVTSPFISRILKIPTTPVEIMLGAIAGYAGFLHHLHLFEVIAEFGFLYLMFLAGTEVNLKKVLRTPPKLVRRALLYMGILYFLSFVATIYLNLSNIFILIMPLVSIGLVAALAKEHGSHLPWIELSIIVGSIGEVISIAVLTIASATFEFGLDIQLFLKIFYLVVFIVLMLVIFRILRILFWWYPEIRTLLMPYADNLEQDIRISLSIFFVLIAAMLYLDLELAFGAFIAGIFVPTFFEHKDKLPEKLSSYGFGFFVPIFFIYIGSTFELQSILIDGLVIKALLITALMIMIRLIGSLAFHSFMSFKGLMLFGLSHSMPLTLLVAVATLAYHEHSIDQFHYYAFILASLFEVIITMVAIKIIINPPKLLKKFFTN